MGPVGVRSKKSMTGTTRTYGFTFTLGGVDDMTDELQGALLRAGCDDGSLWARGRDVYLSFDRESESLGDAIGSAVKDVEKAGYTVARIEVETREP
jgi:hypothetical protein